MISLYFAISETENDVGKIYGNNKNFILKYTLNPQIKYNPSNQLSIYDLNTGISTPIGTGLE